MAMKRTTDRVTSQVVKIVDRVMFTGLSHATIDGNKIIIRQSAGDGTELIFESVISNANLQALGELVRGAVTTDTVKKSYSVTKQINDILDKPVKAKRSRRPNITPEEFVSAYLEVHAKDGSATDVMKKLGCSSPAYYRWYNKMKQTRLNLPKLSSERDLTPKQIMELVKSFK